MQTILTSRRRKGHGKKPPTSNAAPGSIRAGLGPVRIRERRWLWMVVWCNKAVVYYF